MNADLIVQPIDEIRAAAETLVAGLGEGQVFSPERWDHSVTTLARCHDQVGGDTRRQIYDAFGASTQPNCDARVKAELEELGRRLQSSRRLDEGSSPADIWQVVCPSSDLEDGAIQVPGLLGEKLEGSQPVARDL